MAWEGVPDSDRFNTLANYAVLAACGLTHSFTVFLSLSSLETALKYAEEKGVLLFACCPELMATDDSITEAAVKKLSAYPALAGYFLFPYPKGRLPYSLLSDEYPFCSDEPKPQHFGALLKASSRIERID